MPAEFTGTQTSVTLPTGYTMDEDGIKYNDAIIVGTSGVKTILSGEGAPGAGTGANADWYIDALTQFIYGPKTDGAWPDPVPMVGPQGEAGEDGPAGPQGEQGAGVPEGFVVAVNSEEGTITFGNDNGDMLEISASKIKSASTDNDLIKIEDEGSTLSFGNDNMQVKLKGDGVSGVTLQSYSAHLKFTGQNSEEEDDPKIAMDGDLTLAPDGTLKIDIGNTGEPQLEILIDEEYSGYPTLIGTDGLGLPNVVQLGQTNTSLLDSNSNQILTIQQAAIEDVETSPASAAANAAAINDILAALRAHGLIAE